MIPLEDSPICEICKKSFPRRSWKNQPNRFCSRACYFIHHANEAHILRPCLHCGKEMRVRPAEQKKGIKLYCSFACRKAAKRPGERKCKGCGHLFTPVEWRKTQKGWCIIVDNSRRVCSKPCISLNYRTNEARKQKISRAFTGSNHPNWAGGLTQEQPSYRGPGWKRRAAQVRKKQHYRCVQCGRHEDDLGRKLDVNHVERYHNFTDHRHANRLTNLVALCHSCHMRYEQRQNIQIGFPWGAGPQGPMQGVKHYEAYLTRETVYQARAWFQTGLTRKEIASRLDVPMGVIYNLIAGKTYRDV